MDDQKITDSFLREMGFYITSDDGYICMWYSPDYKITIEESIDKQDNVCFIEDTSGLMLLKRQDILSIVI